MQRKLSAFVLVLAVPAAIGFGLRPPAPLVGVELAADDLAGLTLINPGLARVSDARIDVSRGRIESVGPAEGARGPYAGSYALPGLVDMHTHVPGNLPLPLIEHAATLYLEHGVTAVREAGDLDGTAIPEARRLTEMGLALPRVWSCGPFVGGPTEHRWVNTRQIGSVDDIGPLLDELVDDGHTCAKVYNGLSPELIAALADQGSDRGIQVMGHVPAGLTLEQAGVPEPQHYFGVPDPDQVTDLSSALQRFASWEGVDEARLDEVVALSLERGWVHTPTLVGSHQMQWYSDYEAARAHPEHAAMPQFFLDLVWHPEQGVPAFRGVDEPLLARLEKAAEKRLRLTHKLWEAGVPLLLGTDAQQPWVLPGLSLQQEMELFVRAGIPAEEVWAMATHRAGDYLGDPRLGRLEAGAYADILIFDEDPTADLAALGTLRAVVTDGKLLTIEQIRDQDHAYRKFFNGALVRMVSNIAARRALREMERSPADH